jgi:hypothetical protein
MRGKMRKLQDLLNRGPGVCDLLIIDFASLTDSSRTLGSSLPMTIRRENRELSADA